MINKLKKHIKKAAVLITAIAVLVGMVFVLRQNRLFDADMLGGTISMLPFATEVLYELGATDISAVCEACTYPRQTRRLRKISDVEVKAIYDLQPSAVYIGESHKKLESILEELDIPTVILPNAKNLGDIVFNIELIGLYEGKDTSLLVESLKNAAGEKPQNKVKAFILTGENLQTVGAGSFITDLFEYAGAENIFKDYTQASFSPLLEDVLARSPQVIITFTPASGAAPVVPKELASIRNIKVKGEISGHPSPRAVRALPLLKKELNKTR